MDTPINTVVRAYVFKIMKTTLLLLLLIIACQHCSPAAEEYPLEIPEYPEDDEWDRDVYTTRHFDDLVLPTTFESDVTQHDVVLVMYTPECGDGGEDLHYSHLPPQSYLYYARHDWVTTPRHLPYPLSERENLFLRYQPKTCPAAFYFAKGEKIFNPDVWNATQMTFYDWVWNKYSIRFHIKNTVDGTISMSLSGPGPHFETIVVYQDESVDLDCYVSYLLTVTLYTDQDLQPKFLLGKELTIADNGSVIVIDSEMGGATSEGEWLMKTQAEIWHKEHVIRQRHFNLAEIYLRNFKQATLLPKFTSTGYEKRPMPDGLQEALEQYYNHSVGNRESEQWDLTPLINDNEVKCTMIPLSEDIKEWIFNILKPIAEQWCGQHLRPTAIYGIREYYKGNILRHHVDRPATHVISGVLPVYIDDKGQGWPLEAVTHVGERVNISLVQGDLLLYESASVIHGRPVPFRGNVYAVTYVHFQPEFDWLWTEKVAGKQNKRFLVSGLKYEFVEPLFIFATEATRRRYIKFEDEL